MLFVKKLKNNTLLVDLEKLEIGKKRKPLNFIAWKWCVILLDINDVGWASGRGDNYPETYRPCMTKFTCFYFMGGIAFDEWKRLFYLHRWTGCDRYRQISLLEFKHLKYLSLSKPKRSIPPEVGTNRPWCKVINLRVFKSEVFNCLMDWKHSEAARKSIASEFSFNMGCSSKDSFLACRLHSSLKVASACRLVDPRRMKTPRSGSSDSRKWERVVG